ncbi:hypothetical protein PXH69_24755 [Rhodococcus qingshengii]|uniref:Uncharacterized protein n=1 Tax=Rhodococcus qingshengii TaxID=334542 RepID=A0AAW6LKK0_RHOSG|nr:hypothetical protein [Rhodococcus qingshengii]MDE8648182.1 hypothetical protein [Rhodococcus qingshengii]
MTATTSTPTDAELNEMLRHIAAIDKFSFFGSIKADLEEIRSKIEAEQKIRLDRKYVVGSLTQEFRGDALNAAHESSSVTNSIDRILAAVFTKLHNEGRVSTLSGETLEWVRLEQIPNFQFFQSVRPDNRDIYLRLGARNYNFGLDGKSQVLISQDVDGPFRPAKFNGA